MSQYKIFRDISKLLADLLKDKLSELGYGTISVYNEVPKSKNIKKQPAVSICLYGIHPITEEQEFSKTLVSLKREDGTVEEFYSDPPLHCYCFVILSAWAETAAEQLEILGLGMRILLESRMMNPTLEQGESFEDNDELRIEINYAFSEDVNINFWRSIGEEIRPSMGYKIKTLIKSEKKEMVRRIVSTDRRWKVKS